MYTYHNLLITLLLKSGVGIDLVIGFDTILHGIMPERREYALTRLHMKAMMIKDLIIGLSLINNVIETTKESKLHALQLARRMRCAKSLMLASINDDKVLTQIILLTEQF
jgi:hypothetical protein